MRRAPLAAKLAVAAVALALPFETADTIVLGFTSVEIALAVALAVVAGALAADVRFRRDTRGAIPPVWALLLAAFALGALLSASLAPAFSETALKAAARTSAGLALLVAVVASVRTRRDVWLVCGALSAAAVCSAVIGLTEFVADQRFAWLEHFRVQETYVGTFRRLSGTFNHANIAAMFFEATLPLLVGLAVVLWRRRRPVLALSALVPTAAVAQAAALTLSRAGIFGLVLSNLVVATIVAVGKGRRVAASYAPACALAALALVVVVVNFGTRPTFRFALRHEAALAAEDVKIDRWYRLYITAPARLALRPGETADVHVRVRNDGAITWASTGREPVRLGARWYRLDTGAQATPELRWPFSQPVRPGESRAMDLEVLAPENPGAYRLEWDVVQEGIIWFTQLTGIRNTTTVGVGDGREPPPTAAGTAEQPAADPRIPPRTELWSAAFDLLSERPLLGIGLDTFRLSYGKLVDLPTWNRTVHSNSLYVETLVSLGILGSLAFFGWLLALGSDLARVLFRSPTVLRAALAAGLFAYLIHGFFDYFLLFSSTGLLFWILCGLWLAATRRSLA